MKQKQETSAFKEPPPPRDADRIALSPQARSLAGAPAPAAAEEEALCRRCGKCCYRKLIIGRDVHTTPFPCDFLDEKTKQCRVYKQRKQFKPNCLNVVEGMKLSAFPADCAYVPTHAPPGYRPARTDWDWHKWWKEFDEIADALGVPADARERLRAAGPDAPLPWERNASLKPKSDAKDAQADRKY